MKLVQIALDAITPETLFLDGFGGYRTTPPGIWLRIDEADGPGGGNPIVRLCGAEDELRVYVEEEWGLDQVDFDEWVER